jgi:hypothetical protein
MTVISNTEARRPVGMRTYDRTWEEIEDMLNQASQKRKEWTIHFERAKRINNSQAMKDAARNAKALEGVEKTLKWVMGEKGIEHPLH